MTDSQAYSLGYKDGRNGLPPWPPVKEGRLAGFYFNGYTTGRIARQ